MVVLMNYSSVYRETWDVVIFGGGYTGFSAALSCQLAGKKTLLVDRRAALLSESGWAFGRDMGISRDPLWLGWLQELAHRGGSGEGWIDGAIAEVLATEWIAAEKLPILYYAAPVAIERAENGFAEAVILSVKSGLRRLSARQWIDATDTGELAALLDISWQRPTPAAQSLNLFFRSSQTNLPTRDLPTPAELPADTRLRWQPSRWSNEQCLSIALPGDYARPREVWLPALRALHAAVPDDLKGALLTHGSVIPFATYADRIDSIRLEGNALFAGASGATLADKFESGLAAARLLAKLPKGGTGRVGSLPKLSALSHEHSGEVAIAGLGTGGAVAAIAAAREGAKVFAFDAMPFAGGIGTGGGIHFYYFGVKGGLQEEIDHRVREIMPLFGTAAQIGGFHPDAKKLVLDAMLADAGVTVYYDATLASVTSYHGNVEEAIISTPAGPKSIRAKAWVDATGDADLAAKAGADYRFGRDGDGLPHAYSQSSGRAEVKDGVAKLRIINFDAGFCDPTDEEDLTRARIEGIRQYGQKLYQSEERPTYIAPAIGLRQSRHIETDYTLSLDDLICRREFSDSVGYTGCHYDNHARDYEFESDEAAFWVWVCQQWYGRLACEIPFRILLPRALKNVMLACRASGVSEEAHPSFRMQRDMQRIGEVAGMASALATQYECECRDVPYKTLRAKLIVTGAVRLEELPDKSFGHQADAAYFRHDAGRIETWLTELQIGPSTAALWHLYRAGDEAYSAVTVLLGSPDDTISWRAAAILAMWGNELAEPRLLRAIINREDDRERDITRPQQEWFYVPRWYGALTFLKKCITSASLPLLEDLAADERLPLNLRNAIALACEALAQRHTLSSAERIRTTAILEALLSTPIPHSRRSPKDVTFGEILTEQLPLPTDRPAVKEDYTWQLHYAIARARVALGLPAQHAAWQYLEDSRLIVRRALKRVLNAPETHSSPNETVSPSALIA